MYAVISLLQIFCMRSNQRFSMRTRPFIKQAALRNKGLIKITIGIQQQTNAWQESICQLRA